MDYISQILDRANKTMQSQNEVETEMTLDIDGTELKVKRLPVAKIFELLNEAQQDEYDVELEMIYLSAYETFNNEAIMQLNESHEPHDIVKVVFGDDPILIGKIATAIIKWYNLENTLKVQVKSLKK
nr:MAG TPA: hypothetical protein [Caudoviricetes sp.]